MLYEINNYTFHFSSLNESFSLDYTLSQVSPIMDSIHLNLMEARIIGGRLNVNLPQIPSRLDSWCRYIREDLSPDGIRTKFIPECLNKEVLDKCDLQPNYMGNHLSLTRQGETVLLLLDCLNSTVKHTVSIPIITGPFSLIPRIRAILLQRVFLIEGLVLHPDMSSIDNVLIGNTPVKETGRSFVEHIIIN